jgi:hypothetical protein
LLVEYLHVVYTLPAELRGIAYQNKAVIYDLLMKASAETTLAIAADPKHLGARIGIIAVLHTWGSALTHHPHVHMIVPGGGLSEDGSKCVHSRPGFLVHVKLLSCLFRGRFLTMLIKAHAQGHLRYFADYAAISDRRAFKRFPRFSHAAASRHIRQPLLRRRSGSTRHDRRSLCSPQIHPSRLRHQPAAIPLDFSLFTPPPKQPPRNASTLFPALHTTLPTLPPASPANCSPKIQHRDDAPQR